MGWGMTRSPYRHLGKSRRRARLFAGDSADAGGIRDQDAKVQPSPALPRLDERLARELVQGLVQSATARGRDPVARLQEFRTLQQAAVAIARDAVVAQTAERLVREADLALQELLTPKS